MKCLFLIISLVVLLFAPRVQAQSNGRIDGTVQESSSGAMLPGANVSIGGTSFGASTDADGAFVIEAVAPGRHTVVATLLGYESVRREVDVSAGETVSLDFRLRDGPISLGEVLAVADRPFSAASSRAIRNFDLQTRPARSTQDLLRLAPGLVTSQHAGGGKAEQIFLRGFDADHGTDVAIYVDGMPVNMVSHGHGQGYADLHFVIPETVEAIDVAKGPYFARYGNLATAGAVTFRTKDHLTGNLVRADVGSFNSAGLTALYQPRTPGPHQNAYLAASFYTSDGPFESRQGFRRFNLFGKAHTHLNDVSSLALAVGGYGAAWDASGQIPVRALEQGRIGRFGAIDDLEGGTTGHLHASAQYLLRNDFSELDLQAYTVRYDFKLFSNFTFFLEDPDVGDMIEQTDGRTVLGLNGTYGVTHLLPVLFGIHARATLGSGFRADEIAVSLWHSPDRIRDAILVDAAVDERNFFLWGQEELVFSENIRLSVGLRGDYFTFDVEDRLDTTIDPAGELPHASGYAQQLIISPKASLVISPTPMLDLFGNVGTGFHTNDARAVIIGQRVTQLVRRFRQQGLSDLEIDEQLESQQFDPAQRHVQGLPRAIGAELGIRTHLGSLMTLGAAAWLLDLENEFVFVGDAGTTELSGRTRRVGMDLEARAQLLPWLIADADLNLSRGHFRDEPEETDRIPLAPRVTSTGGISAQHPNGVSFGLRYRYIGDRPANEVGSVTAEGYTVLDAFTAYSFRRADLTLSFENLFDVAWNEAQFDTESRLPGEEAPVSELHFSPGNPFNVRLGLGYRF